MNNHVSYPGQAPNEAGCAGTCLRPPQHDQLPWGQSDNQAALIMLVMQLPEILEQRWTPLGTCLAPSIFQTGSFLEEDVQTRTVLRPWVSHCTLYWAGV